MGANIEKTIFSEYEDGTTYKNSLGRLGIFEQGDINEHFFIGDQWYNANCGNTRPLARHNVISRIGNYKMSLIASSPVTVNYSAEGVPNTADMKKTESKTRDSLSTGQLENWVGAARMQSSSYEEINLMMEALSDYYKVTSERVKMQNLLEKALRESYIKGTGILYTYWDDRIRTGLYADCEKKAPISGDIACEVLDVNNIVFGNPNIDDVELQPYIIIAQRKNVDELKREARRNKRPKEEIDSIKPDNEYYKANKIEEPTNAKRATVLTKIYKDYSDDGSTYTVKAVRVVKGATIRKEWDMKIKRYPLAVFQWERRSNSIYGESEITYLIPNQIAINRMLTASVWAIMMMGMPLTVINKNMFPGQVITNNPGQILEYSGDPSQMKASVDFKSPGNFSYQFDNLIQSMISNTLQQSGANDAALGDIRPDNMSAIIAVREAATAPMQLFKNRFYQFIEDIARIWSDFWVNLYGVRSIKIEDDNGTWYMPFDGERYKDLVLSVKVDVGASTLWSESQSIQTLDNLFGAQIINAVQYLERLPKGIVPNLSALIKEMKQSDEKARSILEQQMAMQQQDSEQGVQQDAGQPLSVDEVLSELDPETRNQFLSAPVEKQEQMLNRAMGVE